MIHLDRLVTEHVSQILTHLDKVIEKPKDIFMEYHSKITDTNFVEKLDKINLLKQYIADTLSGSNYNFIFNNNTEINLYLLYPLMFKLMLDTDPEKRKKYIELISNKLILRETFFINIKPLEILFPITTHIINIDGDTTYFFTSSSMNINENVKTQINTKITKIRDILLLQNIYKSAFNGSVSWFGHIVGIAKKLRNLIVATEKTLQNISVLHNIDVFDICLNAVVTGEEKWEENINAICGIYVYHLFELIALYRHATSIIENAFTSNYLWSFKPFNTVYTVENSKEYSIHEGTYATTLPLTQHNFFSEQDNYNKIMKELKECAFFIEKNKAIKVHIGSYTGYTHKIIFRYQHADIPVKKTNMITQDKSQYSNTKTSIGITDSISTSTHNIVVKVFNDGTNEVEVERKNEQKPTKIKKDIRYAWKAARTFDGLPCLIKLRLPKTSKIVRCGDKTVPGKYRTDKLEIIDIYPFIIDHSSGIINFLPSIGHAVNTNTKLEMELIYSRNSTIFNELDMNQNNKCSKGLHFHFTINEALEWFEEYVIHENNIAKDSYKDSQIKLDNGELEFLHNKDFLSAIMILFAHFPIEIVKYIGKYIYEF